MMLMMEGKSSLEKASIGSEERTGKGVASPGGLAVTASQGPLR